ncbi:DUF2948 family protein [Pseudohoeflea coraliihabitans]|uniref:DUF2948 family protein n=1 Tax=Pseudohoeflea coraliihabitans TaxID=2860393 RepID=A0ABS6WN95_9HYPH|nr:DUF2948 family protein [Pseudohoeflea sp. DP4N28-3]MBW3097432.1 DUF2948 family protein [Pseudohoeflea sp. DP4N28-3]
MERLKLLALDEADIAIVSACLQDAVFRAGDLAYTNGQLTLEANRFVWESAEGKPKKGEAFERRRALLAIKRAEAVRSRGVDRAKPDAVHAILALRFLPGAEGPGGTIEIVLAGGGAISVDVECIEVQLGDLSGSWGTAFRPRHPLN